MHRVMYRLLIVIVNLGNELQEYCLIRFDLLPKVFDVPKITVSCGLKLNEAASDSHLWVPLLLSS